MKIEEIKDAILYILYESHENIFNPDDTPVSERILKDAVDAEPLKVETALKQLMKGGFVEEIRVGGGRGRLFFRITGLGMEEYEHKKSAA